MFSHVDYVNFLCYIENRLMKQRNQFVPTKYGVNECMFIIWVRANWLKAIDSREIIKNSENISRKVSLHRIFTTLSHLEKPVYLSRQCARM